mmetsp:Transcript_5054/g.9395  ORF Transcript_5054/g.9395 Transcript_5054/m.9395 type:complete len:250 (-) Transcript_5054:1384-2133(-)
MQRRRFLNCPYYWQVPIWIIQHYTQFSRGRHHSQTFKFTFIRTTLGRTVYIFQSRIISKYHTREFGTTIYCRVSPNSGGPTKRGSQAVDVMFLLGRYHAFPNRIVRVHHSIHSIPHIWITECTHIIDFCLFPNITRWCWLVIQHVGLALCFYLQSSFVYIIRSHLVIRREYSWIRLPGCCRRLCSVRSGPIFLPCDVVYSNGHSKQHDTCPSSDCSNDDIHSVFVAFVTIIDFLIAFLGSINCSTWCLI